MWRHWINTNSNALCDDILGSLLSEWNYINQNHIQFVSLIACVTHVIDKLPLTTLVLTEPYPRVDSASLSPFQIGLINQNQIFQPQPWL